MTSDGNMISKHRYRYFAPDRRTYIQEDYCNQVITGNRVFSLFTRWSVHMQNDTADLSSRVHGDGSEHLTHMDSSCTELIHLVSKIMAIERKPS